MFLLSESAIVFNVNCESYEIVPECLSVNILKHWTNMKNVFSRFTYTIRQDFEKNFKEFMPCGPIQAPYYFQCVKIQIQLTWAYRLLGENYRNGYFWEYPTNNYFHQNEDTKHFWLAVTLDCVSSQIFSWKWRNFYQRESKNRDKIGIIDIHPLCRVDLKIYWIYDTDLLSIYNPRVLNFSEKMSIVRGNSILVYNDKNGCFAGIVKTFFFSSGYDGVFVGNLL